MKILLLWLLPLLDYGTAPGPAPTRVTFSPLTKAAYLAARKTAVSTKPQVTFPLRKVRGSIVIPIAKGPKVFRDKGVGTDDVDQAQYDYEGYLPQFRHHTVVAHLWERTNWLLLGQNGPPLELYDAPQYSPDFKSFVVAAAGIVYSVYPNEIRLFRFENGRWLQVWGIEPVSWEPEEIRWLSANTLLLKKKMWTGKNPGTRFTYAKLTIQQLPQ